MTYSIRFLAVLAAGLWCGSAFAQALQMQRPVAFAPDSDISDAIKTECTIGTELADAIKQHSSAPIEFTTTAPDPNEGRVLQLEINDAVSMGNAWMGHQKFVKVRGALYENGKKVAGFKARRNSMGGAFSGFKGSCSVLGRTVEALGEDIGGWLSNPVDGAGLGD